MSNVIKAYTVRYGEESKKTIDTHLRIDFPQNALPKKTGPVENKGYGFSGEFVEGLRAVVIDELPDTKEQEEKAGQILENAKKEAKAILEAARKEAEQIKNEAYTAAQKKGYDDGMLQTRKEQLKLRSQYEEQFHKLQLEYDKKWQELEPMMADLIAALVEKITGIMVEDKKEVILALIGKAIKNPDAGDEINIRVSKEDYEYVSTHKGQLSEVMGRELPIYILEDGALKKNQCMIETGQKVINCSLDVQLHSLMTDIKLISNI